LEKTIETAIQQAEQELTDNKKETPQLSENKPQLYKLELTRETDNEKTIIHI